MRVNRIQPRLVYRTTVCNGVLFFFDAELGSFLKPLGPFLCSSKADFVCKRGRVLGNSVIQKHFFNNVSSFT